MPFSRPRRPAQMPGDAAYAPDALMMGPGRSWDAEVRWSWVDIRISGEWRPGRLVRWRLHQGSTCWVALVRWGSGAEDFGWYMFDPNTIRVAPARQPADRLDRAVSPERRS